MSQTQGTATNWAVWAIILSIVMIIFVEFPNSPGFFSKVFAVILGTVLGTIGAIIGDAIRKFAIPDSIFTGGGITSLVKAKLFWKIGPQTIGVLIGVFFGVSIALG
jgi:hypothetical protein